MPKPLPNEKENDYMKRCIPIVLKEGTAKDSSQAAAICHSMFKKHKEEHKSEQEILTFEGTLIFSEKNEKTEMSKFKIKEDDNWVHLRATAVIGNRLMKGMYIPYDELKKSLNKWNGTYHDINHMGTSYPHTEYPYYRHNNEYIIGYQDKASANDETKAIEMDVHIYKKSVKYEAWRSFIEICKAAGKIPNVSMSITAKRKAVKAKDIGFDNTEYGDDDYIPYIYDITPKALTTAMEGECSDKDGCGLCISSEKECSEDSCACEQKETTPEQKPEINEKEKERIAYLQRRIKELKGEKK